MVIGEFKSPSKFDDTNAESSHDKETRWRIRNSLILAKLYNLTLPETPEFNRMRASLETSVIIDKFINPIFSAVTATDNTTTQLLTAVWGVIAKTGTRLVKDAPENYRNYVAEIQRIVDSPDFKMTDKVRLMSVL